MKSKFFRIILFAVLVLLILPPETVSAQEFSDDESGDVIVGLSFDRHTGPIKKMVISPMKDRIATLSEDRTLKIWDYPSYQFLNSVNMPEKKGYKGQMNVFSFWPYDSSILLVADDSGTDYEYRGTTKYDLQSAGLWHSKKNGALFESLPPSVSSSFFFYIVNCDDNRILDRVGDFPDPVSQFVFSPSDSLLLVLTAGEVAALFDTRSMLLINEFTFDDEITVCGSFTSPHEFVIITSDFIYKYRIQRYVKQGFSTRSLTYKKAIRKGFWGNKKIDRAFLDDDNAVAYLFSGSSYMGAIDISTGKWIDKKLPPFQLPVVQLDIPDSTTVKNIDINGKNEIVKHKTTRIERDFYNEVQTHLAYQQLFDNLEFVAPDSLFTYRNQSSPIVKIEGDGINIWYSGEDIWHLNENGLKKATVAEVETISQTPLSQNSPRIDFTHRVGEVNAIMVDLSHSINLGNQTIIVHRADVPYIEKSTFKHPLPSQPYKIYSWVNDKHFLISLQDGTLRFYNAEDGEEELALFITKDGDWVMWDPQGFYDSSNSIAANMIEWRDTDFASVITKKPKDVRRQYYQPYRIEDIVMRLFDKPANREIKGLVSIDSVYCARNNTVWVDYSLHEYNPIHFGPYGVFLYVDGELYDSDRITHSPRHSGGSIVFQSDRAVNHIQLCLKKMDNSLLSSTSYNTFTHVQNVYLTTVAVDDYTQIDSLDNLFSSVNDASTVRDLIRDPRLFSKRRTHVYHEVIYNDKVSNKSLNDRYGILNKTMCDNDLALFYFSGHGRKSNNGSFDFLIGRDNEVINLNGYIEKCSRLPGYKLFIVDACFSGTLSRITLPKVAIICSSRAEEFSIGQGNSSESLFTESLKNSVSFLQREKEHIDLNDLYEEICKQISSEKQHPVYNNVLNNLLIWSK